MTPAASVRRRVQCFRGTCTPNAPRCRSPRRSPALSDRADPVPDEIWDEAARHYDEPALAALILSIATTNVFNRLNVTTWQVAGH